MSRRRLRTGIRDVLIVGLVCLFAPLAWPAITQGLDDIEGPSEALDLEPDGTLRPDTASPRAEPPGAVPSSLSLEVGEVRPFSVDGVIRIAIGDPEVMDVTVVSENELLLKAGSAGTTNLILWDRAGQHITNIEVIDPTQEALEDRLRQLLQELDLPGVQVTREEDKIFLTGEVPSETELDQLEQMLAAYGGQVTNLVVAPPPPPPPPPLPPPAVKLTVQLVEMNRNDTDKLGVDWMDRLTFTETAFGAAGPADVSQAARLGEAFRVGALSRTGASAVVNMLVSEGKARILAEPKLVAASGKEATTTLGVEVPVITVTSISAGTVSQNIEFKQTGVELKFEPTVLEDGHSIQLVLNAKVSSIDTANAITVSGITVPGFRVRETKTEIVTDSGQTVFIAGLLQDEEKKNLSQLPGIGNIPVLGPLFRSTEFTTDQTELVIMVTPEITTEREVTADRAFALDQALASAELAAAVDNPSLRYALQVQQRIASALTYPTLEADLRRDGRVTLRLHLLQDGTLERVMITEPSGTDAFDREALRVAESQKPYPPFPSDLVQHDLWLDVPVLFRP